MSYRDPYYSAEHTYQDAPEYNPYSNNHQQHPTYDQSRYTDDDRDRFGGGNGNGYGEAPVRAGTLSDRSREKGRYEDTGFPPALGPPK